MSTENIPAVPLPDSINIPNIQIHITLKDGKHEVIPLNLDPITMGSEESTNEHVHVIKHDTGISRTHCTLTYHRERGVILEDRSSKNGTFIGKIRVHNVILPLETIVNIGRFTSFSLRTAGSDIRLEIHPKHRFGNAVGRSDRMLRLFSELRSAAESSSPLVIIGERGTGKSLLARIVHQEGMRKDGPLIEVTCGALPTEKLDARLFGDGEQMKGALSEARGGTLLLEDVDEMPIPLQAKLIRALKPRAYARIIGTSRRRIQVLYSAGAFDPDLYLYLAESQVFVPALRFHREDIPILVQHFLGEDTNVSELQLEAMDLLVKRPYLGNVTELKALVERYKNTPNDWQLRSEKLNSEELRLWEFQKYTSMKLQEGVEKLTESFQRYRIADALRKHNYVAARAIEALGVSHATFYRLIKELNITIERPPKE